MKRGQRFERGSGCYTCRCCGKQTRETGEGESSVELCRSCYIESGLENEHYDGDHEERPNPDCPLCKAGVKEAIPQAAKKSAPSLLDALVVPDRPEEITGQEIAAVVAEAAGCDCLCHRYGLVHVHKGTIYAHDQGTWDNLLKRLNPSEVKTVPSYRYKHGDTAERLLARCKAAERLGEAEDRDAAEDEKALAGDEDLTTFHRYLGLKEQAPAEWAVRIEKQHGRYQITRCVGISARSFIDAGDTFEEAVKALEFLITGWAIGKGIRE